MSEASYQLWRVEATVLAADLGENGVSDAAAEQAFRGYLVETGDPTAWVTSAEWSEIEAVEHPRHGACWTAKLVARIRTHTPTNVELVRHELGHRLRLSPLAGEGLVLSVVEINVGKVEEVEW